MIRLLTLIAILATSASALADDRLQRLSTSDAGQGWLAVGRLNIGGTGFCTGALVAPDQVLTAAHCLYDADTGALHDISLLQFLAGWRNGRADAYRSGRRAVIHPRYRYLGSTRLDLVAYDLALIELDRPIRLPGLQPYRTGERPRKGDEVGLVSYAKGRAEAPSLQEECSVLAGRAGVLMLSCSVDFGSSGAPVFIIQDGEPRIVSVVSAKADAGMGQVALGTSVSALEKLQARLAAGQDVLGEAPGPARRFGQGNARSSGGAKFISP